MTNKNRKVSVGFGKFLKELRESRGYSLQDVQDQTGISTSYLHRIEKCERLSPTLPVINSLAKFYGIPINEMVAVALNIEDENVDEMSFEGVIFSNNFSIFDKVADEKLKKEIVSLINYIIDSKWTSNTKIKEMMELSEKVEKMKRVFAECEYTDYSN